jgi:uncharacterized protein (DUF58 family)
MNDSRKYFRPEVLNKIAHLELRARQVVDGFLTGLQRSRYAGFSVEFADRRQYVPGDDTRHIDWRFYAKTDRFYIKQYEVETNLRTHLLLDCSGSMAYPEHPRDGRMTKWDYAATVVASLANLLIRQQDGVGLILFDDDVREQLPVSASAAVLSRLTGVVERNAPRGRTDVGSVFPRLADQIPHRGMVVIASDLLANMDDVLTGLRRFRYGRHDVLVLHVLDHDEIEFPFTDRTLFEGLEAPLELLTDPQSLRASYRQAVEGFIAAVRSTCLNHRIDYALLSTADPLDVALTRFLANLMHRMRAKA